MGVLLVVGGSALWPWTHHGPNAAHPAPHRESVRSEGWPSVTVNFNLRSLDNTPLGTFAPSNSPWKRTAVAQQVTGVVAGGAVEVSRAVGGAGRGYERQYGRG